MRRALLLTALVLAGCGGAHTAAPDAGWTTYRDPVHAFSVRFPSAWHRAVRSQTPHLTDPRELFTLATFPLPRRSAGGCAHVPTAAGRRIRAGDVLVSVDERLALEGRDGFRPRPRPMRLGPRTHGDFEVCVRPTRVEEHWFSFSDRGRAFHVLVAFGPRTGDRRRSAARRVLDSLRVRPAQTADGVAVTLPDGWRLHRRPLASTDQDVLAASSFPIPDEPPDRNCTPRAALDAMPPDGAWLYLLDYGWPPSSHRRGFGARPTGAWALRQPARPYECMGVSRLVRWKEAGRFLQAHLYLGSRAPAQRRRQLEAAFDSLLVRG